MGRACLEKPKSITMYSKREESNRKKTIGRLRMRWEDLVKNDEEELRGGIDWKVRVADRDGWKAECIIV